MADEPTRLTPEEKELIRNYMDQNTVIDSIKAHLEGFDKSVTWGLITAVPIALAGVRGSSSIEIFKVEIPRQDVFIIAECFFCLIGLYILIRLWRLNDLVYLLDEKHFERGLTKYLLDKWPLNPFGYFRPSLGSRIHAGSGTGLLAICYFLSLGALGTYIDIRSLGPWWVLPVLPFMLIGVLNFLAIKSVFAALSARCIDLEISLYPELKAAAKLASIVFRLSILLAAVLVIIMLVVAALMVPSNS